VHILGIVNGILINEEGVGRQSPDLRPLHTFHLLQGPWVWCTTWLILTCWKSMSTFNARTVSFVIFVSYTHFNSSEQDSGTRETYFLCNVFVPLSVWSSPQSYWLQSFNTAVLHIQ